MDKKLLEKYLKHLVDENDTNAAMALRGVQSLFASEGASVEDALRYAADHIGQLRGSAEKIIENEPAVKSSVPAAANISGVPECRAQAGAVEIVLSGKNRGDVYPLPGEAAKEADIIASNLKDAVVAAVINKSRFKLKLLDVKNGKGEITETILQAEYERPGMIPIRVWINSRGEVGALAAVLRKAVANSLPELAGS